MRVKPSRNQTSECPSDLNLCKGGKEAISGRETSNFNARQTGSTFTVLETGVGNHGGHFRILPTAQDIWFLSQLFKSASCSVKAASKDV